MNQVDDLWRFSHKACTFQCKGDEHAGFINECWELDTRHVTFGIEVVLIWSDFCVEQIQLVFNVFWGMSFQHTH